MQEDNVQPTFPALLASSVHDIKNSLGTLLELIRQLTDAQPPISHPNLGQLAFEANRINHSLMQLLVLYKIDARRFSPEIDEYPVADIVREIEARQAGLLQQKRIVLETHYPERLLCYCDFANVCNALATILNNAQRYCRNRIRVAVAEQDQYIVFTIEDDGAGYPPALLSAPLDEPGRVDWIRGNTGLGLYFVAAIAAMHGNNGNSGYALIDNASSLGGARFRLFLP